MNDRPGWEAGRLVEDLLALKVESPRSLDRQTGSLVGGGFWTDYEELDSVMCRDQISVVRRRG